MSAFWLLATYYNLSSSWKIAEWAEMLKVVFKYASFEQYYKIIAVGETLGPWGRKRLQLIQEMRKRIASKTR